jgi:hypothetical protein
MRNSELGKGHPVTPDGEMPYYPEDNPDGGTVTRG